MSPKKKDETKKERKLLKKLEKKQRKLEQKLFAVQKKLGELKERHKTAPKATRKATKRVVAKPKKRTHASVPKKAAAPFAKRPRRVPRLPSKPSPAALVSAVTAALAQKPPAADDRDASERSTGGVTP